MLGGAALLHGAGIASLGLAPTWTVFVIAAIPAGFGAGCLDGGSNGLVLDLYREGRGRAMNLLHLFFSLGALSAPLVVGLAVESGVPWQTVMLVSGLVLGPLAVAYVVDPDAERPARPRRDDGRRRPSRRRPSTDGRCWPVRCCCSASPSPPTWPPRSACPTGSSGSSSRRR